MAAEDEAAFTALVADDNALLMKVVASSANLYCAMPRAYIVLPSHS